MPNLEGLGLQNFRTFQSKEYMKFAPITIITGANNAGKSSVIKAIQLLVSNLNGQMLKEKLTFDDLKHELGRPERIINREIFTKPKFEEDNFIIFCLPLSLGGKRRITAQFELHYKIIKNKKGEVFHEFSRVAITHDGVNFAVSELEYYDEPYDDVASWSVYIVFYLENILSSFIEDNERFEKLPIKEVFEPNINLEKYLEENFHVRYSKVGVDFDMPLTVLQNNNDSYEDILKVLLEEETIFGKKENISRANASRIKLLEKLISDYHLKGYRNQALKEGELFANSIENEWKQTLEKLLTAEVLKRDIKDIKKTDFIPEAKFHQNLLSTISKDFNSAIESSIRKYRNIYSLPTSRGKNREWFVDEQNDESVKLIRNYSNIPLSHKNAITEFIKFWLGKGMVNLDGKEVNKGFDIGKNIEVIRVEDIGLTKVYLRNYDNKLVPLVDLGFGISQLLPIIMKIAVIARDNSEEYEIQGYDEKEGDYLTSSYYFKPTTLLIEEPEANLHPALQSKLAEMLIDAGTRFNIQFIIETHSEYLIYKMQEYIGNGIIRKEDVALYYLNHPETVKLNSDKKYVNPVEIGEDGSIEYEKYFGTGFFDEQTNLKLSLLNIQRDKFLETFAKMKEKFATDDTLTDEQQFQKLKESIDKHFKKLDFSTHQNRVGAEFPNHSNFQPKTRELLASAYHLMEMYDYENSAVTDYSAAVIQFGRAMECEFMFLMKSAKVHLLQSLLSQYTTTFPEDLENLYLKADWGTVSVIDDYNAEVTNATGWVVQPGITNVSDVKKHELKNFISNDKAKFGKISFGETKHFFNLLKYQSLPTLQSVRLINHFCSYMDNSFFNDWRNVIDNLPNLDKVVDERNNAAHTYGPVISQNDAINYKAMIEPFLRIWTNERKV